MLLSMLGALFGKLVDAAAQSAKDRTNFSSVDAFE